MVEVEAASRRSFHLLEASCLLASDLNARQFLRKTSNLETFF